jgi:hypothetical protein
MLTIKCAACKQKLFKYHKIGRGSVLRCHKNRIPRGYGYAVQDGELVCGGCGRVIGRDKGSYFGMDRGAFTTTGTTSSK